MPNKSGISLCCAAAVGALLTTACGPVEVPILLTMDPSAANTLSMQLPPLFGGIVVTTDLVGNVQTTVLIDSDELVNPLGAHGTVRVDDFFTAADSINLNGFSTGPLCTAVTDGEDAGGTTVLRPIIEKDASFDLTIPTTTLAADPNVRELLPPLPLLFEVEAQNYLDLDLLMQLVTEGTGLTIHQVIDTAVPDDVPLFGGSPVTVEMTLSSSKTPISDPLLDACEEAGL